MVYQPDYAQFFSKRAQALLNPRLALCVTDAHPLPIYTADSVQIITDRGMNARRLLAVSQSLRDLRVIDLKPSLLTLSAPAPDKCVARICFHHVASGGMTGSASDLTYYLDLSEGHMRVEMLEIRDCPAYALAGMRLFCRSA